MSMFTASWVVLGVFASWTGPMAWSAPVEDPQNLLGQLDQAIAAPALESAFHAGDQADLRHFVTSCIFGCGADGCSCVCNESTEVSPRIVSESSPQSATWVESDGSTFTLAADDYQRISGNLLRHELEGLEQVLGMSGHAVLQKLAPIQFLLKDGTALDAFNVEGVYRTQDGHDVDFTYTVGKSVPAVGQMLFSRLMGQKMYKVLKLTRAP